MSGVGKRIASRLHGWVWLALWATLLWLVHAPWYQLGGIVAERARWAERLLLGLGLVVGSWVGAAARDASWSHGRLLRRAWMPAGALVALASSVLQLKGSWAEAAVLTNAWLAYWAGLDAARGAWPLATGRHQRLNESIGRAPARHVSGRSREHHRGG